MDDDKIVELYWNRDEAAITATSDKYGAYCLSISQNILGNREDAQECVNDTYLRAWSTIPPHRPAMLSTFLGKITRNLSFDRYKANRRDKRGGSQTALVLDELNEIISDKSSEAEFDRAELISAINRFLSELPQDKRKMFVCRYWYAYSIPEIAKRLEMTENNVSVSLNRTRQKLRNYLKERGFDL
ncbi:MAG: sigma-70 family RNA polymerase sigma factor [Ruminiclostridium sp.]|nr:sigma-70 family RNA polymerase sigma factor [Ruminiclostridium sp.]